MIGELPESKYSKRIYSGFSETAGGHKLSFNHGLSEMLTLPIFLPALCMMGTRWYCLATFTSSIEVKPVESGGDSRPWQFS